MDKQNHLQKTHPMGESQTESPCRSDLSLSVDTYDGRVHVEWDPHAAVTPFGQLPFFIDFLKTTELFEPWINDCPVSYSSNNAPEKINVLGTLFFSVLAGHQRYSHITTVRSDNVNPQLLGMTKVASSDSARRAFKPTAPEACQAWQQKHLRRCYEMLLDESWILDIDTTVKPLFGHQEGAVLGYNPTKPGRPSHVLHTYFMANTRLVLDVEVRPGNETAAKYTMPGLWSFLDGLPQNAWPAFIRGDCAFGNERDMRDAEQRGIPYLFKLRQTSKVKSLIKQAFSRHGWVNAGQGYEGIEDELRLTGWTKKRRVIVLRRLLKGDVALQLAENQQLSGQQLELIETQGGVCKYEYIVLITSLPDEIFAIAQHYRDRGDCENNYDELKNQWGWGGYTTHDLKRCQIMARIIAQVYNWWSLYVRLAIPDRHAEAITSRPLLLHSVAKQTSHGGQRTLTVTSSHGKALKVQQLLASLNAFLFEVKSTAQQLTWEQRWCMILSKVFSKFLNGRQLRPLQRLPAPT